MTHGKDKKKYEKIYQKKGVLTKKGGYVGRYGQDEVLDGKWDRYGHSFEGAHRLDEILSLAPESIIDIGSGWNEFIIQIRQLINLTVEGDAVKFSEEYLGAFLKFRFVGVDIACPGADIIASAHNLPFQPGSYDLIVSFDCMEHIPEEEVPLVIQEFHRVANRIYLQVALTESETLIDDEKVHVCVKPKEWWLEAVREYFPNAKIRHHSFLGTPRECVIIYGTK
jgi:cyclopropane fatty-acyl-phospholipid synthase-like methyltransferase